MQSTPYVAAMTVILDKGCIWIQFSNSHIGSLSLDCPQRHGAVMYFPENLAVVSYIVMVVLAFLLAYARTLAPPLPQAVLEPCSAHFIPAWWPGDHETVVGCPLVLGGICCATT